MRNILAQYFLSKCLSKSLLIRNQSMCRYVSSRIVEGPRRIVNGVTRPAKPWVTRNEIVRALCCPWRKITTVRSLLISSRDSNQVNLLCTGCRIVIGHCGKILFLVLRESRGQLQLENIFSLNKVNLVKFNAYIKSLNQSMN